MVQALTTCATQSYMRRTGRQAGKALAGREGRLAGQGGGQGRVAGMVGWLAG